MTCATHPISSTTACSGPRRSILIHCQYLYGIGHFVRAIELARSLVQYFDVHVVSGGATVSNFPVPENVRFTQLPAIFKEESKDHLIPLDKLTSLDTCLAMRAHMLSDLVNASPPDILLTEHFPFGLLFEKEVLGLIERVRHLKPDALVVSSVRDVIDSDQGCARDGHICALLDRYFDLVMVHGDERVAPLHASFPLIDQITIPLVYTGYVVAPSEPVQPDGDAPPLLVGAIGGGRVGQELLTALAEAHGQLVKRWQHEMLLFRGAFHEDTDSSFPESDTLKVHAFDREKYRQALAKATGIICLGGYNSILESVSMSLPALVYKRAFLGGNREQALRIKLFAASGLIGSFDETDLIAGRLTSILYEYFSSKRSTASDIDFRGASNTCRILLAADANRQLNKQLP